MGKNKKIVNSIKVLGVTAGILIILFSCLSILKSMKNREVTERSTSDVIIVELFYNSPCESCHENMKFDKAIRKKMNETNQETKVACNAYNIFKEADRNYMEKRVKESGLSLSDTKVPFALIDGKIYQGDYDEIGNQIEGDLNTKKDVRSIIASADSTDSVVLLFTTYSCDSCAEVKNFIQNSLKKEYEIVNKQGEMKSKVKVIESDILVPENLELLNQLMGQYAVPNEDQQVPIIFYKGGYLSGRAAIEDKLQQIIKNGSAMDFHLERIENTGDKEVLHGSSLLKIAVTGFVNGLNPCSASMLLMVLSLLLVTGNNFLKGSLGYILGKFFAYMGMGMGIFWFFTVIEESYVARLEHILTMCFAFLALVLSILNFVDFWSARKKNYGRIIVQLPKRLRHFNHIMIQKLGKVPTAIFLPLLFVLGAVISAGEFFCTGQLYAASILYMTKQKHEMTLMIFWMLLVYVLAMCIPQVIMIFIINKSRNLLAVSRFTLQGMTVVKLIYAFVFLLLFILLLFF
ncbi:MAG: hypothetical protein WCD89_25870 [Anaerocolumna sp.]